MTGNKFMRAMIQLPGLILLSATIGCSSTENKPSTLRDIDMQETRKNSSPVFVKPKSEAEIQKAYSEYLNSASAKEIGRHAAMGRLAELEMARFDTAQAPTGSLQSVSAEDLQFRESTQKTIKLLNRSIEEYPDAKDNDKVLYQLARSYERLGDQSQAIAALRRLAQQFPKSGYYAEAQFRLGEFAFVSGDYLTSESAYSEVIFAAENNEFLEKAFVKRGWSRYKQRLFELAIEDYVKAIRTL
jgi:TolA-binding protein